MSYITKSPIICLISDTTVSILQIQDSYIQQLVQNSNNTTQQPIPQDQQQLNSNKRKSAQTKNHPDKRFKSSKAEREYSLKYYHRHQATILAKKRKKRNKEGVIQLLNNNPDLDIDKLIRQQKQVHLAASTTTITTTKTWIEILDYQRAKETIINIPDQHRNNNKRKLDPSTTSTIQDYFSKKTKDNDNQPP
jgi:hypothetical protein